MRERLLPDFAALIRATLADGATTIVEVKFVAGDNDYSRRVQDATKYLKAVRAVLKAQGVKRWCLLVALVIDTTKEYAQKIEAEIKGYAVPLPADVEVRVFGIRDLLSRYGFPLDNSTSDD